MTGQEMVRQELERQDVSMALRDEVKMGRKLVEGDVIEVHGFRVYGQGGAETTVDGRFLVESAKMAGGGYGHGPGDHYPDGWQITLVPLGRNDAVLDQYPRFRFYQSGCFTVIHERVAPVGRMMKRWGQ